jgi:phospholipid/cholesterol/gamma-HCH transport system substrate-binding protein
VTQAIRKNLRNFLAVLALIVVAAGVSYYILQEQRLRIPVLEERPFQLQAEFETAQATVPGQGQTIRVAGVRVGDVADVELVDGRAVVTFDIDREYLPIYRDATILMRPQTGLRDMFFQLDPGTRAAGEYEEGQTVPMANTAPDVNLDEVLAALDDDSQAYLRALIVGAGKGLEGRGRDLARVLKALGPINENLDRLNTEVAKRDENLSRLIHNLSELTRAVGRQDSDIARMIAASNASLSAIAEQDPDVQEATRLLPATLAQTRDALAAANDLGRVLGPAFDDLRPFARKLPEVNAATRRLAESATPVIKGEIRPFVRAARPVVPDLREAANRLSDAAPKLTTVGRKLNRLGNMAAYNPRGSEGCPGGNCPSGRDEGYLYWAAWTGHNAVSVFGSQDANGLYRRIYFTASCANLENLVRGSAPGEAVHPIVLLLRQATTGLGPLFDGDVCQPLGMNN